MIVLFSGTHASGKTVLCEHIAKAHSIPFFASKSSQIHADLGIPVQGEVSTADRLRVQYAIANSWSEQYHEATAHGGVFDRTPIDFAAYALGDIRRSTSDEDSAAIKEYVNHCMNLITVAKNVLLVDPLGLKFDDRGSGKASVKNVAYADKIHLLILGMLVERKVSFLRIPAGSIDNRIESVSSALDYFFDQEAEAVLQAQYNQDAVDGLI